MVSTYISGLQTVAEPIRPLRQGETVTHEGGIVSKIDAFSRLRRFLILGTDQGTYYAGAADHTTENLNVVKECIALDGVKTVQIISEVSTGGRAPKNDPAMVALAACTVYGDKPTREAAYKEFGNGAIRIPTHLMHHFTFRNALSEYEETEDGKQRIRGGMGSGYRRAITRFYQSKSPKTLAYHAVKYGSRDGVSQADMLRLARPTPQTADQDAVFKFIVDGELIYNSPLGPVSEEISTFLEAAIMLGQETDVARAVQLIKNYGLPREAIKQTALLNSPEIWDALLGDENGMPMTALVRNLGKMTNVGLLTPGSSAVQRVISQLGDQSRLIKARVHPMTLLAALKVYEQGRGEKSNLTWTPVKSIINALDEAFYLAFGSVTPTNKRLRLALDVSASMDGNMVVGLPFIDARMASAAMALVTASVEKNVDIVGYSDTMVPVPIRPSMRLDEVVRTMKNIQMGGTYCSLPIRDAIDNNRVFDGIVSYTDNETFDGSSRNSYRSSWGRSYGYSNYDENDSALTTVNDYLQSYRQQVGLPVRHAVVAVTSTGFSIADANDPGQLDVVGFDTAAPGILSEFFAGRI